MATRAWNQTQGEKGSVYFCYNLKKDLRYLFKVLFFNKYK